MEKIVPRSQESVAKDEPLLVAKPVEAMVGGRGRSVGLGCGESSKSKAAPGPVVEKINVALR